MALKSLYLRDEPPVQLLSRFFLEHRCLGSPAGHGRAERRPISTQRTALAHSAPRRQEKSVAEEIPQLAKAGAGHGLAHAKLARHRRQVLLFEKPVQKQQQVQVESSDIHHSDIAEQPISLRAPATRQIRLSAQALVLPGQSREQVRIQLQMLRPGLSARRVHDTRRPVTRDYPTMIPRLARRRTAHVRNTRSASRSGPVSSALDAAPAAGRHRCPGGGGWRVITGTSAPESRCR